MISTVKKDMFMYATKPKMKLRWETTFTSIIRINIKTDQIHL